MTSPHLSWKRPLIAGIFLTAFAAGHGFALARPDRGDSAAEFARLHALLKPQPGESKWADVPWLTSLPEARKRAVAEDKPLFVWRAGGGEVLGRA
jgi:hypothetical protein